MTTERITSAKLHVVLGGTGAVGSALVGELAGQGKRARAVSRRDRGGWPAGVEWRGADVENAASVAAACEGAEVVYHAAQPAYTRWAQEFPAMQAAIVEGVSRVGAKLVFADNLYTYGPVTGPLSEDSPQRPQSKKGRVRLELAGQLLAAHRSGKLRVAIGRASDFFGPNVQGSTVGSAFFRAVLAGKRALLIGRADAPHSYTFTPDFARALIVLGEREDALGRIWHVPAGEPLSGRNFARLIAREAGVPYRAPVVLPPLAARALGVAVPIMREVADVLYQVQAPFVTDGSAFARTFNFAPTDNAEAVRRTVAWLRQEDAKAAKGQLGATH